MALGADLMRNSSARVEAGLSGTENVLVSLVERSAPTGVQVIRSVDASTSTQVCDPAFNPIVKFVPKISRSRMVAGSSAALWACDSSEKTIAPMRTSFGMKIGTFMIDLSLRDAVVSK